MFPIWKAWNVVFSTEFPSRFPSLIDKSLFMQTGDVKYLFDVKR